MSAQWTYDNGIAYADGTGIYEKGWYAATPLTAEACADPEEGPYKTRAQAEKKAAELASEEVA